MWCGVVWYGVVWFVVVKRCRVRWCVVVVVANVVLLGSEKTLKAPLLKSIFRIMKQRHKTKKRETCFNSDRG